MSDPVESTFATITGTGAGRIRPGEARNGVIHVVSLTLTKTADALIDPKLVLSWLLTALSAPGAMIGRLVPVREAGALLPQLALARRVEASPQRKRFWAAGSAVQGLAALGIAASAFGVGLLMASGLFDVAVAPLAAIIAIAGAAFLLSSVVFMTLREPDADTGGDDDDGSLAALVEPMVTDGQLRLFVASRAALAVTALAPPFIVMLSTASGRTALDDLGPLVMASTAASVLASYLWGRLSDHSSRQTLAAAGALGAAVLAVVGAVGPAFGGLGGAPGAAAAIFAAQIAYEGVRAGRKLHLTDMAEDAFRARYTALFNTLIGLALLAGGLFGLAADRFGAAPVLLAFALIAALGALLARGLDEVQTD